MRYTWKEATFRLWEFPDTLDDFSRLFWQKGLENKDNLTGNTLNLRITNIFAPCSHLIEPIRLLACVLDCVWCLRQLCVAPSEWPPYSEATRSVPIQTSPNCPFPRRLISCSDSRGISHTSLVLTDRSARRGMPLWQGTTKRQQSPAARSAHSTRQRAKKEQRQREGDVQRVSAAPCRRQRQASEWHNNWKHSKHQSWEPAPLFSLSGGHMSWLQVKRFRMWPLSSILIIRLISLLTSHMRLILIKLERCDVALADELFTTGFLCNNLLSIFFLIAKTNRNLLKCSHFLLYDFRA